ncbi:MAG: hypothetical protein GX370_01525 [Clostridia bacterium]|jgi:hypothetical protein|nr:hypothetical protein [Clostridia bacterium]
MLERMDLNRRYSNFSELVAAASARELGFMIINAEYTRAFSVRLKKIISELDEKRRALASISCMFNTKGDIAIIDETLVGKFLAIRYKSIMEEHYRGMPLNKIARSLMDGGEKKLLDFLSLSYDVIYETLHEIYKEIKCRKDILKVHKEKYNIASYNKEDAAMVTIVLMVLEDIIKYLGRKESYILTISALKVSKSFSAY